MESQELWIPFTLPELNDLLAARGKVFQAKARGGRTFRQNAYNQKKKDWQMAIVLLARAGKLKPVTGKVTVHLRFHEKDKHRDPDGVIAGASKIVLDALSSKSCGVLPQDNWKTLSHPRPLEFSWAPIPSMHPGVMVALRPECAHSDLLQLRLSQMGRCSMCPVSAAFLCFCGLRFCCACAPDGPPPWRMMAPESDVRP